MDNPFLRWSVSYKKSSVLRVLLWLAGQSQDAAEADGWTEPMTKTDILKAVGVSASERKAVFAIVEQEFELGVRIGHRCSYRLPGVVPDSRTNDRNPNTYQESQPGEARQKDRNSIISIAAPAGKKIGFRSSDRFPIRFSEIARRLKRIETRSILFTKRSRFDPQTAKMIGFRSLLGGKRSDFDHFGGKVIESRSFRPLVCMYESNTPQEREKTYIQAEPPTPLTHIEPFAGFDGDWFDQPGEYGYFDSVPDGEYMAPADADVLAPDPESHWRTKRTLALLADAGWKGRAADVNDNMRRWACESVMIRNGVGRPTAKKLATDTPLDQLEEAIDYWLYLRAKTIRVPLPGGGKDVPRPGWLVGHLRNDYGMNHGYTISWRWPDTWLCPDCGAEHHNGAEVLCDACAAENASADDDLEPAAEPGIVPEPWWAESLNESSGTLRIRDAWQATLGQLELQLDRATFETWVQGADALYYKDGVLAVGVPSPYAKAWLEKRLLGAMQRTLRDLTGLLIDVEFLVYEAGGLAAYGGFANAKLQRSA